MEKRRLAFPLLGAGAIACFAFGCASGDGGEQADPNTGDPGGTPDASFTPDPVPDDDASTSGCPNLGELTANGLNGTLGSSWQNSLSQLGPDSTPVLIRTMAQGTPASLVGVIDPLGVKLNANLRSCTHCLLLMTGCVVAKKAYDCSAARYFFPTDGAAVFDSMAASSGQSFAGHFDNVHLVEITFDTLTNKSKVVPGGDCYDIARYSFRSTETGSASSTDAGATDAGSDAGADSGAPPTASPTPSGSESGAGAGATATSSYSDCTATSSCTSDYLTNTCLPQTGKTGKLCTRPCTSDSGCVNPSDVCTKFGTAGYCLPACSGSTCTVGRSCVSVVRFGGSSAASVCIPSTWK